MSKRPTIWQPKRKPDGNNKDRKQGERDDTTKGEE